MAFGRTGAATPEEMLATARDEGRELSDDELDQVSGGALWASVKCPKCCDTDIEEIIDTHTGKHRHRCRSCGRTW